MVVEETTTGRCTATERVEVAFGIEEIEEKKRAEDNAKL